MSQVGRERRVCLVGNIILFATLAGVAASFFERKHRLAENLAWWAEFAGLSWCYAGFVGGWFVFYFLWHPRRVLGLVPCGWLGMALAISWLSSTGEPGPVPLSALGATVALVFWPLARTYVGDRAARPRRCLAIIQALSAFVPAAFSLLVVSVLTDPPFAVEPESILAVLAGVCGAAALGAAWFFRREALELLIEGLFLPMYRFRAAGPGLAAFPRRGPVLVIANHAAWLDPMWLAKVLPRRVIPMMINRFYDLPVLRWLMIHVAGAIRVDTGRFRREVPELAEAVAALDRGECVLIFPEGAMRRSADRPLRMFGQGVWHILRERPRTPVVVCWIEGGWGSYFSYAGGPPTRNKRFDWLRPIRIAVGVSHPMAEEALADQRRTRLELMRECLALRGELGLEVQEPKEDPLAG